MTKSEMTKIDLTTNDDAADPAAPDLRCRIIVNAERLFREIGYRKTTVADIAHSLRMSAGNVYRFFPSKMAINEAVAERLLAEIEQELAGIAGRRGLSVAARLEAFITAMHAMSKERFTDNRRMHEMVEVAMAESWDVIHRHIDAMDRLLCALVAEGSANGEFAVPDAMVAARCVQSAVIRFCHPTLITQCADEVGPSVDAMIAFVLAGLGRR